MELGRWPKRAMTSTTAVMVIRPIRAPNDGDVEETADDETASDSVGANVPITVL